MGPVVSWAATSVATGVLTMPGWTASTVLVMRVPLWMMPLLQVIAQYVLDKYSAVGPSMVAADAEARATANLAARIHDQYITPVQVRWLAFASCKYVM